MPTADLYRHLKALGVSAPYASQIAHGAREPGLALAIRIWRRLGLKLGPVAGLTRGQIARLEHLRLKRLPKRAADRKESAP
jgi:hypothetical protein